MENLSSMTPEQLVQILEFVKKIVDFVVENLPS